MKCSPLLTFVALSRRTEGSSLVVDCVTDQTTILNEWPKHFKKLGESHLVTSQVELYQTEASTYKEYDNVFDTPVIVEEIELKKDSSGGHNQLSPCHLLYCGPLVKNWICKIFRSILAIEDIPATFKCGITCICPVYKGKGKDPLVQKSYFNLCPSQNI